MSKRVGTQVSATPCLAAEGWGPVLVVGRTPHPSDLGGYDVPHHGRSTPTRRLGCVVMQRARRSARLSRRGGLRGVIPTLLVWAGSGSARACTISFRRAREHNTAMSGERGGQLEGRGPVWIARLVWGL